MLLFVINPKLNLEKSNVEKESEKISEVTFFHGFVS